MREVKLFLTELLPLIRDWKATKLSKKIETADAAVTLCHKIDAAEQAQVMNPGDAQRFKHDLIKSASNLVAAGGFIRDVKPAILDNKQMLRDSIETKLLK